MLFTDSIFLFYFLPFALLAHRLSLTTQPTGRYGNLPRIVIFLSTLIFYASKEFWWVFPFFICIGFDFIWANVLVRTQNPIWRKRILVLSVIQNLSLLFLFKYWNFFITTLEGFLPGQVLSILPAIEVQGMGEAVPHPLSLPPGISFYTFESLSFLVDVYRREVAPPKNPLEYFAFIGMFPRFVAGPIVRYKQLVNQFKRYQGMQWESGLYLFCIGLFLKCVFADSFARFSVYAFDPTTSPSWGAAWVGVFAYTMQIYFDFSGYSLMAIGLGQCLGFQFPSNFNCPYLSCGFQDFWRRWHITLSTWLRDYVYIPLGGSQGGSFKTYRNLFLTMLLGGIWHGANWTFIVWGIWHGLWLILERLFSLHKRFPARVYTGFTFFIVMMGWVPFRAQNIEQALKIFKVLFNPWAAPHLSFNWEGIWISPVAFGACIAGLCYAFMWEGRQSIKSLEEVVLVLDWKRKGIAFSLALLSVFIAFSSQEIPFLYFQF